MKRKRRTEILIKDSGPLAARLADEIRQNHPVDEIETPQEGLVMIKLREQARNSLFYLGEVLVTEAKARIGVHAGLGLVQGTDPDLARDLAVIDAAWNANLAEIARWEDLLKEAEQRLLAVEAEEYGRIMQTRVDFASMQEEDYV